jgi:hypothetical protein
MWRARKNSRIPRRMKGVLEEAKKPGRLFAWRGIKNLRLE